MSAPDSDELLQAYRRASAKDAGSPPQALRHTILAEAAAAARRRTPAANDSRMHWRAVAAVAVLGVALLLWRQVDQRLPTAAPREAVPPAISAPPAVQAGNRSDVGDSAAPTTPAAPTPPAPPSPAPSRAPAPRPPSTMAAAESESRARAGVQTTEVARTDSIASTKRLSDGAPAAAAPAAPTPADSSAAALLRRHFPEQYASDRPPHALWLVQDAAGNALRRGELGAGEDLAAIAATLEPTLAGRRLSPWQTDTVPNAHGQPIEISVSRAQ
ncbi:MAG: hypothetical protein QM696_14465 [Steroidobacteraceae bacterium]